MTPESEQILRKAADICGQLPLEHSIDIEEWLREAADFCEQFNQPEPEKWNERDTRDSSPVCP